MLYNITPKAFSNDLPCSVPAGPAACLSLFFPWALSTAQVIKILSQLGGSQPPSWLRRPDPAALLTTAGCCVPECGSDAAKGREVKNSAGATRAGMQGGIGSPWPDPGPVYPSIPLGVSGSVVSLRERETQTLGAPPVGLAVVRGGEQLSQPAGLSLPGCSGCLRRSPAHYCRLAGMRSAARGAGARRDTGTAAGSSPLPPLLSGLVKFSLENRAMLNRAG